MKFYFRARYRSKLLTAGIVLVLTLGLIFSYYFTSLVGPKGLSLAWDSIVMDLRIRTTGQPFSRDELDEIGAVSTQTTSGYRQAWKDELETGPINDVLAHLKNPKDRETLRKLVEINFKAEERVYQNVGNAEILEDSIGAFLNLSRCADLFGLDGQFTRPTSEILRGSQTPLMFLSNLYTGQKLAGAGPEVKVPKSKDECHELAN